MPKRTSSYLTSLIEDLKDPAEAANYLNAALSDSEEMFLLALRDVAESRHMARVAADVGVSRESLYRMLTASGNPTYRNFCGILRALGVEFASLRPSSGKPASKATSANAKSKSTQRERVRKT